MISNPAAEELAGNAVVGGLATLLGGDELCPPTPIPVPGPIRSSRLFEGVGEEDIDRVCASIAGSEGCLSSWEEIFIFGRLRRLFGWGAVVVGSTLSPAKLRLRLRSK